MPARNKVSQHSVRRARKRASKHALLQSTFSRKKIVFYVILAIVLVGIIFVFKSPSQFWNSSKKLSVAYPKNSGDVEVVVFDPRLKEITRISVPSTTEVTTARQLGTWRVKSLWQLGENENIQGTLLAETLTNHLRMPTIAWADYNFEGFVNGSARDAVKSFFTVTNTNLGFKDKLYLLLFTTKVHNTGYKVIDLSKSTYLRESKLQDGTSGYTTFANLPQEIAAVFSATSFSGWEVTGALYDQSDSISVTKEIGKVIEVLGAKVALVSTTGDEVHFDCIVRGKEEVIVSVLEEVFHCEAEVVDTKTSFDVEMTIGDEFVRRF